MVAKEGRPFEFLLTAGSFAHVSGLSLFDFDLRKGAAVYGDKGYKDYSIEDVLKVAGINLLPICKKMFKRKRRRSWPTYMDDTKNRKNGRQLDRTEVTQEHSYCYGRWL